jgi:hypothetical protein
MTAEVSAAEESVSLNATPAPEPDRLGTAASVEASSVAPADAPQSKGGEAGGEEESLPPVQRSMSLVDMDGEEALEDETELLPPPPDEKPAPLPLRPSDEWINRRLSSQHLLFKSAGALVIPPGLSKVTLEGVANLSGIYSPNECTIEFGSLRLCSYNLPSRLLRIHAAPQLKAVVPASQPPLLAGIDDQTVTLMFAAENYQVGLGGAQEL